MAYRDPLEAARLRVAAKRDEALARSARITPPLRSQLPDELRAELEALEQPPK